MASSSHSMIYKPSLYSGAGNRFILSETCPDITIIPSLCKEYQVDGFLLVLPSSTADAKLIIFNDDGSRPHMCGNGLRCVVAHLSEVLKKDHISVETDSGRYSGRFHSWERVVVDMTLPDWNYTCHTLSHTLPGVPREVFSIHTGVPHLVVFVEDVSCVPVDLWGSFLRCHEDFLPQGTNVNFIQEIQTGEFQLRTYERGLERESLACGTGATAAALVVAQRYGLSNTQIPIWTWGDILIKISLEGDRVYLEGPVDKERSY
ncbi:MULTISPECIES: bifunctional diaminopimelate epimerase/glutamate racemase [Chlamydia]|uniref:Diaminopimelate epimerase n=1 Tax=Chlamydophila parapsittaci TaxID=344886 RepID=A0ABX5VZM4_9CHLA|nr:MULTISPECIES: bifunctional diaminopimelate epimerase/glutamate racemase [Chlamydia]AFS20346.1 diaminopimelate epimerase [Chlamydia psittaci GR9]AFS24185.1 diaminopimelate epimerase [Chlamydia psittaci WS/RT/E30]QDE37425.1 diaminopimelate epimerase [Chlamydophila parapsittaci]QHE19087.1 diaminopimelate epimerase [Chlamydia psittaci]UOB75950.1 bifunctional diaminopimelate epimerase/glutamate racemase [Chlamydia psittaci]